MKSTVSPYFEGICYTLAFFSMKNNFPRTTDIKSYEDDVNRGKIAFGFYLHLGAWKNFIPSLLTSYPGFGLSFIIILKQRRNGTS